MKTKAAVLQRIGAPAPYALSRPLAVAEVGAAGRAATSSASPEARHCRAGGRR